MKKRKRKSVRVYDRKIDRGVARYALKKAGYSRPNKQLKDHWRKFSKEGAQA